MKSYLKYSIVLLFVALLHHSFPQATGSRSGGSEPQVPGCCVLLSASAERQTLIDFHALLSAISPFVEQGNILQTDSGKDTLGLAHIHRKVSNSRYGQLAGLVRLIARPSFRAPDYYVFGLCEIIV